MTAPAHPAPAAPIRVPAGTTAAAAVRDADLICTVTAAAEPILESAWVADGAHVNLVGSSRDGPREVDDALLGEMMSIAAGEPVSEQYIAMMREDLTDDTLKSRCLKWRKQLETAALDSAEVVIIGAGMSGIVAAHRLLQAGFSVHVYEKNPDAGGTWFENGYPGCRVDVPNHLYSYSFGLLTAWSAYARYREVGAAFVEDYIAMLAAGGSRSPEELGQIVGIDLADPGFWDAGLRLVDDQVTAAEQLADKLEA